MARKLRRSDAKAGELNLTAMIDVAFQLLSFFIITIHPVDVLTNLNVFRPSTEAGPAKPMVLCITVASEGYLVNGVPVEFAGLDGFIQRMAKADSNQTVMVQCDQRAEHRKLIAALDLCAKAGMNNLSVVSSHKVEGAPR